MRHPQQAAYEIQTAEQKPTEGSEHTNPPTCMHCEAGMSHTLSVQSMLAVSSQRQSALIATSVKRSLQHDTAQHGTAQHSIVSHECRKDSETTKSTVMARG